jgi:hypothetical protein
VLVTILLACFFVVGPNGQLSAAMRVLTNSSTLRQVADEEVRLLAPHQFLITRFTGVSVVNALNQQAVWPRIGAYQAYQGPSGYRNVANGGHQL